MILLTNKDETPGMYKALAMNFKGEIVFGEIHKNEQEVKPSSPPACLESKRLGAERSVASLVAGSCDVPQPQVPWDVPRCPIREAG